MTCLECGAEITGRRRKFCAQKCAMKYHYGAKFHGKQAAVYGRRLSYSDWPQERKERWEHVWRSDYGIYNLASLLMGSNKRKSGDGIIDDCEGVRVKKGGYEMAMSVLEVRCVDCRLAETDGLGGYFCPEKNKEFHGEAADAPRKCNYFQPREDDLEIADASEQEEYYLRQVDQGAKIDEIPESEPVKAMPRRRPRIDYSEVLRLHNEGMTISQISKQIGCSEEAVRVWLKSKGHKPHSTRGNGKEAPVMKPPMELTGPKPTSSEFNVTITPSPVETAFTELKRSKIDRLKDLLGSFTVAELVEAEQSLDVSDLLENVILLAADLAGRKKVA